LKIIINKIHDKAYYANSFINLQNTFNEDIKYYQDKLDKKQLQVDDTLNTYNEILENHMN